MPDYLSGLHFMHPFLLAGLLTVPLLWWLLRVMPPKARRIYLPTAFLLRQLTPEDQTTAKTPWWIILLRMVMLMLIIIAFADPVTGEGSSLSNAKGTVLVAVDNGWASASHWAERIEAVEKVVASTPSNEASIVILPTAPSLGREDIDAIGPVTPEQAIAELKRLKPQPWPSDYIAAGKKLAALEDDTVISHALFISDGTESSDTTSFLQELAKKYSVTVMNDEQVNQPLILRRDQDKKTGLSFFVQKMSVTSIADIQLQAVSQDGVLLDQKAASFPAGSTEISIDMDVPDAIAKQVASIRILSPETAAGSYLIAKAETAVPAGVISDTAREADKSFLNDVYYLRRALETDHDLVFSNVGDLVEKNLSVIIWPDSASLTEGDVKDLTEWVDKGGLLIRFAGPNLAAKSAEDTLLPVEVRSGERVLQGTLTGDKPLGLEAPSKESPFADMPVPKDVTVTHQLLAVPTPDVFEKTWLSLEDGSPLVTGARKEKGMIVLVHTSAGPAWSDFCYSGFYVEMLQRLIARGQSIGNFRPEGGDLRAQSILDGFGRLQPVDDKVQLKTISDADKFYPSSLTPPGMYGRDGTAAAMNMGDALLSMKALEAIPSGARVISFADGKQDSFKIPLLKLAVIFFLLDSFVMIVLAGIFKRKRAAILALFLLLSPITAHAEDVEPAELSSGIYLAYIETGDQRIDQLSYNGLMGLKEILNVRTMAKVKGVSGVNPAADDLSFYPVIYWPMSPLQPALSLTAAQALQNYIQEGGMLLIDTRDGSYSNGIATSVGSTNLKRLTADLAIPALMPLGEGHILTRSFYLTNEFPGVDAGQNVWVEKSPNASNDSVTSLIIGGNEWAAAWSMEDADRQRFPVMPGGDRQREMAYRFGVNMVMAALTGNYKLDQVHSAEILKKLQR